MQIIAPAESEIETPDDHFILREDIEYAGLHLLLDLWEAKYLDDIKRI